MDTTPEKPRLIACTLIREKAEKLVERANQSPFFITENCVARLEEPLLLNKWSLWTIVVESDTDEKVLLAKGYVLALRDG